jgi:hypothetical protein
LKQWAIKLKTLEKELRIFQTYSVEIKYTQPFISKLIVKDTRTIPPPTHDETDPQDFVPPVFFIPPVNGEFAPYSQSELLRGEHYFRFKSENLFLGIASNNANTRRELWNTPTTYGWTTKNLVYRNGVPEQGYRGYRSDLELGDTFLLVVNCDNKTISLKNERTGHTDNLQVNPNDCPLPWKLNVCLLDNIQE